MNQHFKTTTLAIAVACIVFGLPQMGVAQDSKIAVVNTRTLTLMSDEGKVAGDKLQKRLDVIRTEMDKLRKDIEEKDNSLRTRERLLSAQAKDGAAVVVARDYYEAGRDASRLAVRIMRGESPAGIPFARYDSNIFRPSVILTAPSIIRTGNGAFGKPSTG